MTVFSLDVFLIAWLHLLLHRHLFGKCSDTSASMTGLIRIPKGVAANVAATASSKTRVQMPMIGMGTNRPTSIFYEEPATTITNSRTWQGTFTAEEKLVAQLLGRGSLTVRPNGYNNLSTEPVHVDITYNVVQILAFSQAEETMSISGWFTIKWCDPRLTWEPGEFSDISEVHLPSTSLWIPDVGVMNGKSSTDFDFSANVRGRLTVDSNGNITWLHGAVLDTTCPLDVAFFPFDYQTCFLILTPWQSGVKQLLLKPFTHGSTVDNSYLPNSNVSEWEIQSVHFSSRKYRSDLNVTYQYVSIGIHLKRQPLYFVVLVLVPFSMLSALACLIFTLDDTGDRLSVALSLVLSMTMYVVIVSTNAPRSMRTLPVLGIFLLDQLGLLSIATVLAVINNKLYQATDLVSWQDWIYTISGTGASKGSEESHQPFGFNMYVDNPVRTGRGSRWLQANQTISNPINSSRGREVESNLSDKILKLPTSSPVYTVRNSSYDKSIAVVKNLSKSGSEFELPFSDNSPESLVDDVAYRAAPRKLDIHLMKAKRHRSRMMKVKSDKNGWLEADLSTRNSSFSPPLFQHRHHPLCNNVRQPVPEVNNCSMCSQKYIAMNTVNRSPWVEPLTLAPSHTSSNSSFSSSLDSFYRDAEFSPSRLFQTTLTATAAAAYAATKVLRNQSNPMAVHCRNQLPSSKLKRNHKHHSADGLRYKRNKYTDTGASKPTEDCENNETQEAVHISTTARLAASAVIAAFQAAEQLDKENQHQFRINRFYSKLRRKPIRKMPDRSLMYPYRKLASRMDCVQLIAYLLLSTINAIVCLVIMPQFSQDNQPPKQWIQ